MRYPPCLLVVFVIFSHPSLILGESQETSTNAALSLTASSSSDHATTTLATSIAAAKTDIVVISSSSVAATTASTASIPDNTIDSDAGASGGGGGSWGISKAAIGVICGIVGLVVLFAIGTTALYIHAYRHNQTLRQSLSHTSKRVVTAMTPTSSRFPRGPPPPASALGPSVSTRLRRSRRDGVRRTASSNVLGALYVLGHHHGDVRLASQERGGERDGERDGERGRVLSNDPPAYAREETTGNSRARKTKGGLRIDTSRAQDLEKGGVVRGKGRWDELGGMLGRLWK